MLYWPVPTSVESSTVRGRSDSGAAGPFRARPTELRLYS